MGIPYILNFYFYIDMLQSNNLRYVVIAHLWDTGNIDYISVMDNKTLTTDTMDGRLVPDWVREKVAMLRLCEVNKTGKGEVIGRKFTEHMIYVYLDAEEYKQLIKILNTSGDESETD